MTKKEPDLGEEWMGRDWGCRISFKSLIRIRKQATAQ